MKKPNIKLPKIKSSETKEPKTKAAKTKEPKTKKPKTKEPKTKAAKTTGLKVKKPKLQIKKKKLLIVLLAAAVLITLALAGNGIVRTLLKGKAPDAKTAESVSTEQSKDSGTQKEKEVAVNTENFKNYLAFDFINTLESGKYLIRYKTTTVYNGQSFEVETTYATSGSSIALAANDRATIVRDGKTYMMNHTDKTMLSWDVDPSSDNLKRIDMEGITYTGSREENGMVCEEYKTASSYLKLYFKDKMLVRVITVINGQDTVMDIIEVSKEVPASMFEVPQGYNSSEL